MSESYQLGFYKSLRAQVATVLLDLAFRVDPEASHANVRYLVAAWRGTTLDLIPPRDFRSALSEAHRSVAKSMLTQRNGHKKS